jgi:hypothetical protein
MGGSDRETFSSVVGRAPDCSYIVHHCIRCHLILFGMSGIIPRAIRTCHPDCMFVHRVPLCPVS